MRNVVIGIVIGLVLGVVGGVSIIAPRMEPTAGSPDANGRELGINPPKVAPPQVAVSTRRRQRTSLNVASAWSTELPQLGILAKRLETEVWRVSGGGVEIKIHEPGTLVPVPGLFDAVASGAVDGAFATPLLWDTKSSAFSLFGSVPFGPQAEEYLAWYYFGGGKPLYETLYNRRDIHGLVCGMVAPEAAGWFRNEIRTVEDFVGMKMRSTGLAARVLRRVGVETRPLMAGDIFMALESGAIDAAEFSLPSVDVRLGFQELLKHYYFPGWHQPATFLDLMVNKDKWEALTATEQAQIESVCGDNVRFGLAEGEAAQFDVLKLLLAKGVRIHRWPEPILEKIESAWKATAAEEASSDPDFRDVWQSLTKFRENYAIWNELGRP